MQVLLHSLAQALSGINPLDWVIALTLAISTVTAFLRGLIRSLLALLGLIAGILLAGWYAPALAPSLARWVHGIALAEVAAFLLILCGVYLFAMLTGRLLRGAFSAAGLGFLDRLAGAAFGFLRGILLLAALCLPLAPYLQHVTAARTSVLFPYLLPAAHGISFVLPQDFGDRISTGDWLLHTRAITRARHL